MRHSLPAPRSPCLPPATNPSRRKRSLIWSGRFGLVGFGLHSDTTRSRAQGRAIYVLERTLAHFFQIGLVSSIDPTRPDIVPESGSVESIYSPAIRLTYTPPAPLPPPFPRTLSLEGAYLRTRVLAPKDAPGLALYMTSSVFIRHTMKTLYSDLRVEMRRLAVTTAPRRREKSLFVGVTVCGTTRVSGGLGEWQMWVVASRTRRG